MRATTRSIPKLSRATLAVTMFELSPLVTAASASARSTPATANVSRALANQLTGQATGQVAGVTQPASNPNADALASVQKALDASRSYNQVSQQSSASSARQSFLRLFA